MRNSNPYLLSRPSLFHSIPPALKAGGMGAVVGIALLHVFVDLLLFPLLPLLFGLTVLTGGAHPPNSTSGKTANGGPSAGAFTAPGNSPDNRPATGAEQATSNCAAAHAPSFLRKEGDGVAFLRFYL